MQIEILHLGKQERIACLILKEGECLGPILHRWHTRQFTVLEGLARMRQDGLEVIRERGEGMHTDKRTEIEIQALQGSLRLLDVSLSEPNRDWFLDEDHYGTKGDSC